MTSSPGTSCLVSLLMLGTYDLQDLITSVPSYVMATGITHHAWLKRNTEDELTPNVQVVSILIKG